MLIEAIRNLLRSDKVDSDLERKQMAAYKEEFANEKTDAGTPCPKPAESIPETTINPDYAALEKKFGPLESLRGKTITLELHQAARLLDRSRIKVDAFSRLQKDLKSEFDITLKIYSRRAGK
ncbi:MAG: hypothetical protein MJY73_06855 [Bacteroidales bacterium]|nr:hypothetical protein [Bacteroidales bacterium]